MKKVSNLFFSVLTGLVSGFSTNVLSADEFGNSLNAPNVPASTFDLMKVFQSCPWIYSVLLLLSIASLAIWIYSMLTVRTSEMMPQEFLQTIKELLSEKRYEAALNLCEEHPNFTSPIIASALQHRQYGRQAMVNAMQAEGRRKGMTLWQRISLLNEVAVISPMIGLLGTVIGLFFAFYDTSRTAESLVSIFDGLGIAIGTTVAGLIVALLAMVCYTTLKFQVMNVLDKVENESLAMACLVEEIPQREGRKS